MHKHTSTNNARAQALGELEDMRERARAAAATRGGADAARAEAAREAAALSQQLDALRGELAAAAARAKQARLGRGGEIVGGHNGGRMRSRGRLGAEGGV